MENVKSTTIVENGIPSTYHLIKINGVNTWCYESGAIVTDNARLQFIAANA